MLRETLKTSLRVALRQVIVDEWSLFIAWASGRPVSERTICAHLGWYLRPQLPRAWDVDVEYNREGETGVKRGSHDDQHPADLIVHRRTGDGRSGHSLLMLELKVTSLSRSSGGSLGSLVDLTQRYGYTHGVFLDLDVRRQAADVSLKPQWRWVDEDAVTAPENVFTPAALRAIVEEARNEWRVRRRRIEGGA